MPLFAMPLSAIHSFRPSAPCATREKSRRHAAPLFWGATLCAAFSVFTNPAGAVTLRQQWLPGQQLTYETSLNGKLTLLADDESPQLWAGLPTEFRIRGNAALTLETQAVDGAGIGELALRVGDARLRGQGYGQIFEMNVQNGQATALMNGKAAGSADVMRALAKPNFLFRVTPTGRIEGVTPLEKRANPSGNAGDKKSEAATIFDFGSGMPTWMLRALPALWPSGDVQPGAQWTVPLEVPLPAKKENETAPAPMKIGEVTFTLRGEEESSGRKVQRIALAGAFDLDAAKAKILSGAAQEASKAAAGGMTGNLKKPNSTPGTSTELADAKQKMTGDLWLDVVSGQIVRAELAMQSHVHSKGTIKNKAGRTRPTEDWADFDGSLQIQLRKISYGSANFDAQRAP